MTGPHASPTGGAGKTVPQCFVATLRVPITVQKPAKPSPGVTYLAEVALSFSTCVASKSVETLWRRQFTWIFRKTLASELAP